VRPRWTPRRVAQHYGFPADLNGHGQTIGIIDLGEPLDLSELHRDLARASLPIPAMRRIDLPPATLAGGGAPPRRPADRGTRLAIETHIDAEIVAAICPAAALAIYCCAGTGADDLRQAIARAVADGVDVISISWGMPEDALTSGQRARLQAALAAARDARITVCAAAGDAGAAGSFGPTGAPEYQLSDGVPQVRCTYPASSDLVLACGGTSLVAGGTAPHEVVWNDMAQGGWAGGGGVSLAFDRPAWQAGLAVPPAHGPGTLGPRGRILPDVAGLAAMGDWAIWIAGGREARLGGTSAVAPLYAALVALANQRRRSRGRERLGFLNDRLYRLAAAGGLFVSITEGSNRLTPDGPGYDALAGFDACTGWGVPRADRLIAALAADEEA
jgi:kumamolisin